MHSTTIKRPSDPQVKRLADGSIMSDPGGKPVFNRIITNNIDGLPIFVMDRQTFSYSRSMHLLDEEGLRPLAHMETLWILTRHPQIKKELNGNSFYLAEKRIDKAGLFMVQDDRQLMERFHRTGRPINLVRIWSGKNPLVFYVMLYTYVLKDWSDQGSNIKRKILVLFL